MKNFDPYKRIILFFSSLANIVLLTVLFYFAWFYYYADKMFQVTFYNRGNWVVIGLYSILLLFFSNMYGGLRIGQLRRIEIILSQMLSVLFVNIITYIVISLLAFAFVNPIPLLGMMLGEYVIIFIWTTISMSLYNRIFQPWKILLIYGADSSAEDLIYKVEARRDKYAIYDAMHIDEGIEAIGEKMEEFQAVIIGDIPAQKRNDILKYCYRNRIRAYVVPKLSDIILMGADRIHIFDTPFLLTKGYNLSADERIVKRIFDIFLALVLLIVSSPFMLITALAVKLYDGGPVFYRQIRCTMGGRKFEILKFRSMIVDAEEDGVVKLASIADTRITPVGRFIRKVRLDELPQLINILKGEMTFVGPRPERPEIIEMYQEEMPEFEFRMRVKAGLTGFAQVYGNYNTTPYDKLKLDMFYIENYSFWMDIRLIIMTVKTLLRASATVGIEDGQQTALREKKEGEANVQGALQEILNEDKLK